MFDEKKDTLGSDSLHVEPSSVELGRNRDRPRPLRANKQESPLLTNEKKGIFNITRAWISDDRSI